MTTAYVSRGTSTSKKTAMVLRGASILFLLCAVTAVYGEYSDCVRPFGSVLGRTVNGVTAYSNCNTDTTSNEDSINAFTNVFMGMKWQCVEFARRYLFLTQSVVFGGVDSAYQMWDALAFVTQHPTNRTFTLRRVAQGSSTQLPPVGALLIYQQRPEDPHGHVAVVVGCNESMAMVAEQNWSNDLWLGSGYSRTASVTRDGAGRVLVDEETVPVLIGWMVSDLQTEVVPAQYDKGAAASERESSPETDEEPEDEW
jgi:glutathionylspermidine amidase/synthetase